MPSRRSFLQSVALAGLAASVSPQIFADDPLPKLLDEFDYGDVDLEPGLAQTQFEQTQSVLMSLNEDSLLKPWRLRAGLPAPGPDLGGWYDEVDPLIPTASGGHGYATAHCFGQWISALCRGYAINQDVRTRAKVERLLALYRPAISGRFYTNYRYPGYVYDKMVLGLVDAHRYAGLPGAYDLLDLTTAAAEPHLPPRALDRAEPQRLWRLSIGESPAKDFTRDETYTLPENLYIAAQLGAGERYQKIAERFLLDETFFDPLSENNNVLNHHHAYSYFNALNSAMMAYIATGSRKYLRAASNGFDMVAATQSFATGGWGPNEEFNAPGSGMLYQSLTTTHRSFETPCGSFAHFKLTRYLLRLTRDGRYGDSMERVLYNTVLGAKALEPDGRAFYYSDYNRNGHKSYFPHAWPCCSGTLPQVAADYRILIYFRGGNGIYVNLYLPSVARWTTEDGAQLTLTQTGGYPLDGKITMELTLSRSSKFAVRLRIPAWTNQAHGVMLHVNGSAVAAPVDAGFATLDRTWKDGDRVALNLPLLMRLEAIDSDHPDTVALVRGPLVLFALTDNAPRLTRKQLLDAQRIPGEAAWRVRTDSAALRMVPFTTVQEDTYATYFQVS